MPFCNSVRQNHFPPLLFLTAIGISFGNDSHPYRALHFLAMTAFNFSRHSRIVTVKQ